MSKNRIVFSVGLLLIFITIFNGPPLWFKWAVVFFSGVALVLVSLSVSVGRRSVAVKENPSIQEKPIISDVAAPKSEEVLEDQKD